MEKLKTKYLILNVYSHEEIGTEWSYQRDIKFGKNTTKFTKYDGELMRWRYGKHNYPWNESICPPNAK